MPPTLALHVPWTWASFWEALTAIGTAGAFLIASLAWRQQVTERNAEKRRAREAQARQFTVWVEGGGGYGDSASDFFTWKAYIRWLNTSDEAIRDVEFKVTGTGDGYKRFARQSVPVLGPSSDRDGGRFDVEVQVPTNEGPHQVSPAFQVEAVFTDHNGLRWRKVGATLEPVIAAGRAVEAPVGRGRRDE